MKETLDGRKNGEHQRREWKQYNSITTANVTYDSCLVKRKLKRVQMTENAYYVVMLKRLLASLFLNAARLQTATVGL